MFLFTRLISAKGKLFVPPAGPTRGDLTTGSVPVDPKTLVFLTAGAETVSARPPPWATALLGASPFPEMQNACRKALMPGLGFTEHPSHFTLFSPAVRSLGA